ncbi:MAG TPA: hypothetical protein VEO54_24225 [Thermoanaerobaculia bacterium]|nr:hypothetical protein [Thermoanaerobaculia bacterium]
MTAFIDRGNGSMNGRVPPDDRNRRVGARGADDIASAALMDAFYERLVSGVPVADALRGDPRGTWRQGR